MSSRGRAPIGVEHAASLGPDQRVHDVLAHGADAQVLNGEGETALQNAGRRGYRDVVELLGRHPHTE